MHDQILRVLQTLYRNLKPLKAAMHLDQFQNLNDW